MTVSQGLNDLSLPYFNPSLLNSSMDNDISLNISTYFAGINYGYASYSSTRKDLGSFAAGISFISYGKFIASDVAGNTNGTFTAAEYAFNLIYSRKIDSLFTVGINIKPVFSHLERYFSAGICTDLGITYVNEKYQLSAGLVIRNAGFQIKSYTGNGGEPLPLEIIAGVTKRLEHAPFRFSLTIRHLEKTDLTHDYITSDDIGEGSLGDNILRHMILGVEILPFENFWAGAGFNYQRRAELKAQQRPGTAGFSVGFGFSVKAFAFSYGRDTYHLAGAANHISVTLHPEIIFKHN